MPYSIAQQAKELYNNLIAFNSNPAYRQATIILVTSAVCLIGAKYLDMGKNNPILTWYMANSQSIAGPDRLQRMVYWSLNNFLWLFLIPFIVATWVLRLKPAYGGFAPQGFMYGFKIYAVLFAIMLPVLVGVSYIDSFKTYYPFLRPQPGGFSWQRLWVWECFYALQFLAVEYFFRGFMVHGLKKSLGILSLGVMIIPYGMIHIGKPLPEALGSIIAGYILGYLSYKGGNVLPGVLLHTAIAVCMDLLALWQQGVI